MTIENTWVLLFTYYIILEIFSWEAPPRSKIPKDKIPLQKLTEIQAYIPSNVPEIILASLVQCGSISMDFHVFPRLAPFVCFSHLAGAAQFTLNPYRFITFFHNCWKGVINLHSGFGFTITFRHLKILLIVTVYYMNMCIYEGSNIFISLS